MADNFFPIRKQPALRKYPAGKTVRKEIILFDAKTIRKPQVKKNTDFLEPKIQSLTEAVLKEPSHFFSSFRKNPKDVVFQDQEADEKVLLFLRKDFVINYPWIIKSSLLIIFPFFVPPISLFLHINLLFFHVQFIFIFALLYYLFVATYIFVNYITWYFNSYLVTDSKLIEISFSNLIFKQVSETKVTLIQDVSYDQLGVVRNIFDFGDVLVQTAGTVDNFTFESIPKPESVTHIIENIIGKEKSV